MQPFTVEPPQFGEDVAPFRRSEEAIALLATRRSSSADCLGAPGPSDAELAEILRIAARVPDHRRVTPFRFIVIEGEARAKAGEILARVFSVANPEATDAFIAGERDRFCRAPVVVALVSRVDHEHRTPEWEQVLTVGAVGQNLLLAASAHGYGAQWLTEWCAYDDEVRDAFGLVAASAVRERFAGFFYLGTAMSWPKERARPLMDDIVSRFGVAPPD